MLRQRQFACDVWSAAESGWSKVAGFCAGRFGFHDGLYALNREWRSLARPGGDIAVAACVASRHRPHGLESSKLAEKFNKGAGVPDAARIGNTLRKSMEPAGSTSA